jgi:hypothetical protein
MRKPNIPFLKKVNKYFQRTKKYSAKRFILEMSILAFILKIGVIILSGLFFLSIGVIPPASDISYEKELIEQGILSATVFIILAAAFETLTAQAFILWIMAYFTKNIFWQILVSSVIFALLHVDPMLIAIVFPIGIVLAWSYKVYRNKSFLMAFLVTTIIHVNHNLFASFLLWLGLGAV